MATPKNRNTTSPLFGAPRRVAVVEYDRIERERMVRLAREALGNDIAIDAWSDDNWTDQFDSLAAEDVLIAGIPSRAHVLPPWFTWLVDSPQHPAIILLIDDEDDELVASAIENGAADCLVKHELLSRDLARAVHRALGQRRLAIENAKMVEQLRCTNSDLDHVVRALSHDMNANLMVLEDSVRQLKKSHEAESLAEVSENFAHVDACLQESHRFVDDLVMLAKGGRLPTEPERVELGRIARDVIYEQRALVERRGVKVTIDPRLPAVWCHPSRAKEIVVNLVRNALLHGGSEHSPQLAMVRAEAPEGMSQNGYTWVRIYDDGAGIPDSARETIFEPGQRLAGRGAEGSGLGLSIVKKAIEQYGGTICVDPLCGEGFALLFSLPAVALVGPPHRTRVREKSKRPSAKEKNLAGPKSKPWG